MTNTPRERSGTTREVSGTMRDGADHAVGPQAAALHDWTPSTLGHGETMCKRCFITNREAAALGQLNRCEP